MKRTRTDVDFVRVQDAGLAGREDPEILDWAAREGRIVVSRDKSTMPGHAGDRIREGLPMTGLILVGRRWRAQLGELIDDLLLIVDDEPSEWENRIEYLPL